ncbi:MAG: PEGA domain-containing protein [Acidobacteria bacterium]|nr:PEGA domain-containing protein [Acidobacteriota bacterium]
MRLKNVFLAAALIGSFMVLAPVTADAQRRGGGRVVARPHSGRPFVGIGMYRGAPYYDNFSWGYSRWWYPFGYGPYWYGPYWYGSYGYPGDDGQSGSLKLEIKPKNADVFVDGYFAGIVDDFDGFFQSLDVSAGNHSIALWCQGYRTVTQEVHVQRGNSLKLRYQMVPLAAGESQDPRPVPPPESQAPRARRDGPPQPYQPGPPSRRAPPRRPAPPPQPEEPLLPAQATPPGAVGEAPDYAQLAIKVQPAGAQIFIDGEAWQSSQGADRLVVHLPVGVHHVEIRKDGFRTFKTDVQIRTGETTTLNVSLSGQDGQ